MAPLVLVIQACNVVLTVRMQNEHETQASATHHVGVKVSTLTVEAAIAIATHPSQGQKRALQAQDLSSGNGGELDDGGTGR